MEIRKYKKQDRAALIQLWAEVFPDDPSHNAPDRMLDSKLKIDDLVFVVYNKGKENDELLGACMAGYDGHRGWLYSVAVSEKHRRLGVGAALVNKAILSLKELGCIKVNLQIRSTNTVVAQFYKSLGFSVEDRLSMGVLVE